MTQERSFSFTDKALKGLPTPPWLEEGAFRSVPTVFEPV